LIEAGEGSSVAFMKCMACPAALLLCLSGKHVTKAATAAAAAATC
jgi:hypothetical protein